MAYRDYTADGSYWTVRKRGEVYWVVRIVKSEGKYKWDKVWGGYDIPGAAGGAAAQLAYLQGKRDAAEQLRGTLHDALEKIGLGPTPKPAPVRPNTVEIAGPTDEDEPEED